MLITKNIHTNNWDMNTYGDMMKEYCVTHMTVSPLWSLRHEYIDTNVAFRWIYTCAWTNEKVVNRITIWRKTVRESVQLPWEKHLVFQPWYRNHRVYPNEVCDLFINRDIWKYFDEYAKEMIEAVYAHWGLTHDDRQKLKQQLSSYQSWDDQESEHTK